MESSAAGVSGHGDRDLVTTPALTEASPSSTSVVFLSIFSLQNDLLQVRSQIVTIESVNCNFEL
jgi:hypothetical protein